jgi:hypothetical protein
MIGQSMVFMPHIDGFHFDFQRILDRVNDGLVLSIMPKDASPVV